uniref:Uncharacterized protein LOC105034429 isoform X2 n=1 Tax=Elaeis guineensis var. tenera TaxID=51953 RepID=A0A6I9QE53_ELAGV|nr:uncharacterized protein LOC105034429 isoform X2 [Elaeis guineensis]
MEIDGKVPPDLLQEREICALRRKEAKRKMKEKQQRRLLLIKGSDEKLNRLSSPKISISTEQVAMEPQTNPISTPLMPTPYLNQVQWVPSANNYFMIPASLLPSAVEPPITYGVVSNIEGIQSWRDSSRENPFTNTIQGVLQESDNIYIGATSNQIAIKEGTSQDKQCGNKMPYVV